MDEKSLLKRLQNRDEKVFEEIIDRYNAYVTTIVRSLLSSRGTNGFMDILFQAVDVRNWVRKKWIAFRTRS